MQGLSLWFTADAEPELLKSEFKSSWDGGNYVCHRGAALQNSAILGSFRWSPAVKALCILLLRHARAKLQSSQSAAYIEGHAGSFSSSLDYAISKQPNWLLEFFGVCIKGDSQIRKLVQRMNPERKRPGPVRISMTPAAHEHLHVRVYLNDIELITSQALDDLLYRLCSQRRERVDEARSGPFEVLDGGNFPAAESYDWRTLASIHGFHAQQLREGELPAPFQSPSWRQWLYLQYAREIGNVLSSTEIFSPIAYQRCVNSIQNNPSFERLTGNPNALSSFLKRSLSASQRLGLVSSPELFRAEFCPDRPLRCVISPAHAGTFALLQYLKLCIGCAVDINFKFAHSVELVRLAVRNEFETTPDIISLTVATAATLLRHSKEALYTLFSLMPRMSHGIVVPNSCTVDERTLSGGAYLFMSQIPATESFYFDDLVRKKISRTRAKPLNMEPDEVTHTLGDSKENIKAIIGFPHYCFNEAFNGCRVINNPYGAEALKETVVFTHRSLCENEQRYRLLQMALRHAWLELRDNSQIRHAIVTSIVENRDYVKTIKRAVGLFHLNTDKFANVDAPQERVNRH